MNRTCTRCVMDTTAAGIEFDDRGICNYCTDLLARSGHVLRRGAAERQTELEAFVARVRRAGAGKRYDCIVGVSGGVDSSWALVQAVRHGLRPLAVHMDNGWNSELAQHNIANLVQTLGVELHTYVIDWPEYRGLMQSLFDADVIDIEILYDNAMLAVNYRQARANGVKYILSGSNQATEGMALPRNWYWFKYDRRNIRALARRFGGRTLDTFPAMGTLNYIWYKFGLGIQWVSFLDLFDYRKQEVMDALEHEYGYKPYPFKHYESVFTRFYQGYILPTKFRVDKRLVHFSTLIVSGQMTRDEALTGLDGLAYPSEDALDEDRRYFLKKMGWSREQLDAYLQRPERAHDDFPSERGLWDRLERIHKHYIRRVA